MVGHACHLVHALAASVHSCSRCSGATLACIGPVCLLRHAGKLMLTAADALALRRLSTGCRLLNATQAPAVAASNAVPGWTHEMLRVTAQVRLLVELRLLL